jgi:hypothetical protein
LNQVNLTVTEAITTLEERQKEWMAKTQREYEGSDGSFHGFNS